MVTIGEVSAPRPPIFASVVLVGFALLLSSCGGSGITAMRTQATRRSDLKKVRIAHAPARVPHRAAVLQEIGVVCIAVSHGLPAPPRAPFTWPELQRYAAAAAAPERRLVVSLGRLKKLGDARRVSALARAWDSARALLPEVKVSGKSRSLATSIGERLQAQTAVLRSLADRVRLPTCGGVPPR